jgi:hypothetical protein
MSTLNPSIGHAASRRQAASLSQIASWYSHRMWVALEAMGQRRAAPELARVAQRLAETQPELAASLAAQARQWQAR